MYSKIDNNSNNYISHIVVNTSTLRIPSSGLLLWGLGLDFRATLGQMTSSILVYLPSLAFWTVFRRGLSGQCLFHLIVIDTTVLVETLRAFKMNHSLLLMCASPV